MTLDDEIADLLIRWEEAWEHGEDLPVDVLCAGCPQHREAVARRIAALKSVSWVKSSAEGLMEENGADDATHPPDLTFPMTLGGRYRIDALIAEGGHGRVFRGFDPELQRAVALKISKHRTGVTPERLVEEARKLARLRHPGIVSVHDVGRDDGMVFVVSDLIDGENLADRIARSRPPLAEAVGIAAEVADALAFAHEQGFVHRDIKPANILLDRQGKALIADFGIALSSERRDEHEIPTCGTWEYVAPEIRRGTRPDRRSDIYSLGVVLSELLTGRKPFEATTPGGRLPQTETSLDDIPSWAERLCLRCLASDPDERPRSAREVVDEIRSSVHPHRLSRRRWWLAGAAAGGLLSVGGAGAAWLRGRTPRTVVPPKARELWRFPSNLPCTAARFSRDGGRVFAGGLDRMLHVLDARSGRELVSLDEHGTWVRCIEVSPDGRWFLTTCGGRDVGNGVLDKGPDWAIRLWDSETLRVIRNFEEHLDPATAIAFSPDGDHFVSGADDLSVKYWSITSSASLRTMRGHGGIIIACAVSPDGRFAFTGSVDRSIRSWELNTGQERRRMVVPDGTVHSLAISPDGSILASGNGDRTIRLWNTETGEEFASLRGHASHVRSLGYSPDGRTLVSGGDDGVVIAWDVRERRSLLRIGDHEGGITSVEVSASGAEVLTASVDGFVRLCRLPD